MDHGQFCQLQNPYIDIGSGSGDRVPQWSNKETRDFLLIRGELDPNFMETKRNRVLWEEVSARMAEIGYNRTSIQCKCKWKNLVTRYKGCESMGEVEMRQSTFAFYNDMQIIFNARIQRLMWQEDVEGAFAAPASPTAILNIPSDSDDREKKKTMKEKPAAATSAKSAANAVVDAFKEIMGEFMSQQREIEMMWMKAYKEREERRRESENVWRQRMDELESERVMMMRRWEERAEEMKMREKARADRMDALLTTLLNKLREGEEEASNNILI